jgi:hypothetical protein
VWIHQLSISEGAARWSIQEAFKQALLLVADEMDAKATAAYDNPFLDINGGGPTVAPPPPARPPPPPAPSPPSPASSRPPVPSLLRAEDAEEQGRYAAAAHGDPSSDTRRRSLALLLYAPPYSPRRTSQRAYNVAPRASIALLGSPHLAPHRLPQAQPLSHALTSD